MQWHNPDKTLYSQAVGEKSLAVELTLQDFSEALITLIGIVFQNMARTF